MEVEDIGRIYTCRKSGRVFFYLKDGRKICVRFPPEKVDEAEMLLWQRGERKFNNEIVRLFNEHYKDVPENSLDMSEVDELFLTLKLFRILRQLPYELEQKYQELLRM